MDECEQQVLHEQRQADKRRAYMMTSNSTPTSSQRSPTSPSPSTSATTIATPTTPSPLESLNPMIALQSSLISGKFSDLTIIHGTRKWQAHKVVVCSQSAVLESMIEKLEDSKSLNISTYDHEATVLMIEYLYTSTYTTTVTDIAPSFSLPQHVAVFDLACSLSITGLKSLALQKYCYTLKNLISNLSVYFTSVRIIYKLPNNSVHAELRLAVVETAVLEMRNLLVEGSEQRRDFLELTSNVPQFQADIYAYFLCNGPGPEVQVVSAPQELCQDCGAREEGDGYKVTTECKGCGEERTLEFL
ncbi:hypothetical protein ONS96_006764 [Cadophora gregata f. sp. sojae]|nr:hypothetical protein ONS96_006764 [Cadophora gregata f. sp. sojae]